LQLVSKRKRAPRGERKKHTKEGKARKGKERKARIKQGKVGSSSLSKNTCR